jgi:hypothetical protein
MDYPDVTNLLPLILALAAVRGVQAPLPAPAPAPQRLEAGVSLDYEFFKANVQPVFLKKRPGNARCLVCHRGGGGATYLQPLSPGATTWDEEQSRKNFDAVRRLVVPGAPLKSKLLMHPLAEDAGGDEFHGGGHHWKSQDDPEWQTLAAWVRGERLTR